jgi:integrase
MIAKLKLPQGAAQGRVSDTEPGLYLRINRDSKTFMVQASVQNRTRGPLSIGRANVVEIEDARAAARKIIESWRAGDDATAELVASTCQRGETIKNQIIVAPKPQPVDGAAATAPTLQEALDAYWKTDGNKGGRKIERKASTIHDYTSVLELHTPKSWWDAPINAITFAMIDAQHSQIGHDAGHCTADKWARYLRAVYESFDVRNPALNLPKNPVRAVGFFKPEPRRTVVTWAQLPEWWGTVEALKNPIRADCFKFLLLTGLRSNAGSQVRWEELDLEAGIISVPAERMKAGHGFTVPLSRYVVNLLKARQANNERDFGGNDDGYVFPTTGTGGAVGPIRDLNQQGYDGDGKKIRLLPGPQTLRRTFNSVATDLQIPEAHRHILVDHAMPYAGVNARNYYGRMGDDPCRDSLEKVTAAILQGAGVEYRPSPEPSKMRLVS